MLKQVSRFSVAKIKVERRFCNDCSIFIRKKLQEIDDINNVRLFPKESIISFNFVKANKLSSVLNILSDMGYPEKGDRLFEQQLPCTVCSC